ncbi:MAG: hypothetical protein K2K98_10460 [Muribaculaceae bacterium]|nr:hypothetical protein [Muribaculaceae bacterium]
MTILLCLTTALECADAVTQNGSMDYPGKNREMAFEYNKWGALVKDESRGITDIIYDNFGNPVRIDFADGSYSENVYSATGEKLKATHVTMLNGTISAKTTMEYRGNKIYEDGKLNKILVDGGYVDYNGGNPVYNAYLTDYQGNIRVVVSESAAVRQVVNYYPYGALMTTGTRVNVQRYMYNGKELDRMHGLDWYDYGARHYDAAIGRWHSMDDMCYAYYDISPYAYCANNPVNLVDKNGLAPTEEQAARMADYVYGQEKIKLTGGWKESQRQVNGLVIVNNNSGFKSGLFERTIDGLTEYAYVYAGTDFTSLEDWKNNYQQIFGQSEQYKTAIKNAGLLKESISEDLTFVGHSLGGGLAAASAYATGGHAMTFNAAGVTSATVDISAPATIEAYVTRNDELHRFQSGNDVVPIANGNIQWRAGVSSLMGHSIKNFYLPSIPVQMYNGFKNAYISGMKRIENFFKFANILQF